MATLKLKKPPDPAAPPKPPTSRARRAQERLGKRNTPAPVSKPPVTGETKTARKKPFVKPEGRKPVGKAEGRKPFGRSEGKKPFEKREGHEPFSKPEGKPPFRKPESLPAQPPAEPERKHQRRARGNPADAPPKPVAPLSISRPDRPDDPRLSKLMSERGICSRREADEWIENRWVKVDGKVVDQLGARVRRDATIEVDPAASRHQSEQVTILLHKPVGYVSGQPEDNHPPAMVLIKPENQWEEDGPRKPLRHTHLRGLAPAGRLDIDSTGLLVFTQDGRVAKRLIGSHSEVEKEYLVRVEGTLSDEGMKLLHHGLELDGVKLKPARVSWANEDQLRFVLREGRKRQIRRMCEMVGLKVTGLKRVRTGGVPLGKLPPGQWRFLRPDERF